MSSRLTLVPVLETHDHPDEAEQKARDAISRYPDLQAVYVTIANSLPVLEALRERDVSAKLRGKH